MRAAPADHGRDDDGRTVTQDVFWDPHANSASVWAFVALYPVVVLATYWRSRRLLGLVGLSVVGTLGTVSPPASDEAWGTRVVLGERVWLDQSLRSRPGALGLTAVGAAVDLYTFRAAVTRQPVRTAVGTVVSMALMFAFFHRMVRNYDAAASRNVDGPGP